MAANLEVRCLEKPDSLWRKLEFRVLRPLVALELIFSFGGSWLTTRSNHVVSGADIIGYEGMQGRIDLASLDVLTFELVSCACVFLDTSIQPAQLHGVRVALSFICNVHGPINTIRILL